MTMSCSEGTCTLCDEVQCQSYDNASRAFAAFLSRLPKQETSQAADYAHAMEAMEYNLKRTDDKEDEIALDSGSEIHLFSSRAAEKYSWVAPLQMLPQQVLDLFGIHTHLPL